MKKAIYLDARERDLARRVCDLTIRNLNKRLDTGALPEEHMAYRWTRDEVYALREKFEEPIQSQDSSEEKVVAIADSPA